MKTINDYRSEASQATCIAEEANRIAGALRELANAAGVMPGWSEPEPRDMAVNYAEVLLALLGENFSRESIRAAAYTLLEEDEQVVTDMTGR